MNKDRIVSVIAAKGLVRAFFTDTTYTVKKAAAIHKLTPVAAAALGRTLTGAAIISKTLKNKKDTLTIQIIGDGPLGNITVAADSTGKVRGYVENPAVDVWLNEKGKLDVGRAVGRNGRLTVIKDMGLKTPYIGSTELQTGEIAEDFAYYYALSEQIPTVIALGVLINRDMTIKRAGGYMIQLLPGAGEEIISYLEESTLKSGSVTQLLETADDLEQIIDIILSEMDPVITDESNVRYFCDCSRDRMMKNLFAIGKSDLEDILKDKEDVSLECHFCSKKYIFTHQELSHHLTEAKKSR